MVKYSSLQQEEDDDDAVALIMGQAPPRLRRFGGSSNYVELDTLDREGNPTEDERYRRTHAKLRDSVRKSSKNLVYAIIGIAFSIITVAVLVTLHRRSNAGPRAFFQPILTEPLNAITKLSNGTHQFRRSTLMISLAGMHPHYISPERTPFLHNLTQTGFAPPYMTPSFPSQSFPNHYTLVTGMYPVNHGIVGNTFYDPELKMEFDSADPKKSFDRRYWGGQPLWVTAKQSGVKSAVHMWPGSESNWSIREAPDERSPFDQTESLDQKAAHIIEWFDRGIEMPQLMLSYVPNVDTISRSNGISGSKLTGELVKVDQFVKTIAEALDARNLTDVINLVLVSDNGMAPTSEKRTIFLDDLIPDYERDVESDRGWPLAGLRFKTSNAEDAAYQSASIEKHKKGAGAGFTPLRSDETPSEWHFSTGKLSYDELTKSASSSREEAGDDSTPERVRPEYGRYRKRLAPFYVVPDVGYTALTHKKFDSLKGNNLVRGSDGYNSSAPLMRALFLARGPAFPAGRMVPFQNVHVYSAICRSVGMKPYINSDGDFAGLRMRRQLPYSEDYPGVNFPVDVLSDSSFTPYYKQEKGTKN